MRDYECRLCGEEFGSNCAAGDIQCPACDARLCPCCGTWYNEAGDSSQHLDATPAEPQTAPELAAVTARRDWLERELNKSIDETAVLRHLLATVLGEFTKSSDGCHARVSQVTLAKRKQAARMEISDAERRMIGG